MNNTLSRYKDMLYFFAKKGRVDHTPSRELVGCSSPFLWPRACRWINH